jgi:hypothetical protein
MNYTAGGGQSDRRPFEPVVWFVQIDCIEERLKLSTRDDLGDM